MPTYSVIVSVEKTYEIKADTKEEAREIAEQNARNGVEADTEEVQESWSAEMGDD